VVWSGKDGSMLKSFNALPADFTGGVRVAAGDVDGDGKADIIAGAGPGALPQVTVYKGTNLAILQSFYAFPIGFRGGVFLASADVNKDGKADIITGAGPGGLPQVTVYNGALAGNILSSFYDPRQLNLADPLILPLTSVRVGATVVSGQAQILTSPGPGLA